MLDMVIYLSREGYRLSKHVLKKHFSSMIDLPNLPEYLDTCTFQTEDTIDTLIMPWDHKRDDFITTIYSSLYDKSFFKRIQGGYWREKKQTGRNQTEPDDIFDEERSEVTRRIKVRFIEFDWHLQGVLSS